MEKNKKLRCTLVGFKLSVEYYPVFCSYNN